MSKALQDYLAEIGDARFSALSGIKPRTVAAWRRGERIPRPEIWAEISPHAPGVSFEATIEWRANFRADSNKAAA